MENGKTGTIDAYWLKPACEADFMSQAKSPLIHIAADNSTARMKYVVRLREMYEEKNELATFTNFQF
jgi:hypothetical protein